MSSLLFDKKNSVQHMLTSFLMRFLSKIISVMFYFSIFADQLKYKSSKIGKFNIEMGASGNLCSMTVELSLQLDSFQ